MGARFIDLRSKQISDALRILHGQSKGFLGEKARMGFSTFSFLSLSTIAVRFQSHFAMTGMVRAQTLLAETLAANAAVSADPVVRV